MRPHRQYRHGPRRETQDYTHNDNNYGRESGNWSSSSNTRSYGYDSQDWSGDVSDYRYGGWDQRQGGRSWSQGGSSSDRSGGSSGHLGYGNHVEEEGAYRGYDREQDYVRPSRSRGNYNTNNGDSYNYAYDQGHNYNYQQNYDYSYTARSNRDRHYSGNTCGYTSNRNSTRGHDRRDHREQRRSFHSSASRFDSSNESNGNTPASTSPSLTNRLFQHRGTYTRVDTTRSIRDNRSSRRSPPGRLTIQPMERKSGPDEEYLKISLEESGRVDDAEADTDAKHLIRKLLVLDLNGTLVYRSPHRPWRERYPVHGGAAAAVTEEDVYAQFDPTQPRPIRTVHPRPYLAAFREYLFHPSTRRWLDTMVWSSAQPHSVGDMVDKCFGDRKGDLVAIWARDRLGLSDGDYGRKVQTTKDLNKPWDELNSTSVTLDPSLSPPTLQRRSHSAKTTLLLDDSPLKAHLQPYNHLCLKEYDLEMRKQDIAVRELEVARTKLADVIAGKENIEDVLRKHKPRDEGADVGVDPDLDETGAVPPEDAKSPTQEGISLAEEPTVRKRKRKEKKENKKKERIELQLKKLAEQNENPTWVYDETLLAVVGVLDAVKKESNVAAWIRSGGLIKSLIEGGDLGGSRQISAESEGTTASTEELKSPKKTKLSEDDHAGQKALKNKDSLESVVSNHPPPRTSSPPRESSPVREEDGAESETERAGVPLDDAQKGTEGGTKSAEELLWFNHPGALAHWAAQGRRVLEKMGIEFIAGVVGSTG